ncbi:MAG: multiheme c-type cytochrome, partial [candidate division KSB1 bacterium]
MPSYHFRFRRCRFLLVGILFFIACKKDPVDPKPDDTTPPEFKVTDFAAPEQCASCHPNHYQEWQSSMHAYAFVDPVFFAMHDRGQQLTGGQLDQFCTKCHSPIASRSGETPPFFDRNKLSPISTRGVSCDVCHSISKVNKIFNAQFEMSPGNTKFGSLNNPAANPFQQSQFNALFDRSEFCGTCHEVENTFNTRVEETYTEWVQASVAGMSADCQDCHMPTYSGEAAVGGPMRDKVHRHYFVGVDVPLVDFPGADEQRRMSEELLKNSAEISVHAPGTIKAGDTLRVGVTVSNTRAGHNLPSGTAAERQMWIAIQAREANGNLLYQTGQLDANGVIGR